MRLAWLAWATRSETPCRAALLTSWTQRDTWQGDERAVALGTNLANHAEAAASTYANYVAKLLYGRVDGSYAFDLADIRVVMGCRYLRQRCDEASHQR